MPMSEIAYTVSCTFADAAVAERWLAWLKDKHLADVLAGGATHATVVQYTEQLEDPQAAVHLEVRYRFASREAFEVYEREHAPALRAEGLERFPLSLGLTYSRRVGEIVAEESRA